MSFYKQRSIYWRENFLILAVLFVVALPIVFLLGQTVEADRMPERCVSLVSNNMMGMNLPVK